MILLIGGVKGGTAKTTTATNIAVWLALEGQDVLLLDADPQGTASKWQRRRNEHGDGPQIACVAKAGDIYETVRDLAGRYDQIIIDAGGHDSEALRSGMLASHVLYSPLQASQPDIETSASLNQMVKEVRAVNRQLDAFALLARAPTNPLIAEAAEAREALEELPELALSRSVVRDRKVYRDAIRDGYGVVELTNHKARAEIQLLAQEIYYDDEA